MRTPVFWGSECTFETLLQYHVWYTIYAPPKVFMLPARDGPRTEQVRTEGVI